MELKRFGDSELKADKECTEKTSLTVDTSISDQAAEALKMVDANIRSAEQKSGSLLVA